MGRKWLYEGNMSHPCADENVLCSDSIMLISYCDILLEFHWRELGSLYYFLQLLVNLPF